MQSYTPPDSPIPEIVNENLNTTPNLKRGRKRKNLNRSKVYRLLKKTETKLKIAEQRAEKYKKRYYRIKKSKTPSPNTKINILAKGKAVPYEVRKRLLFTECITESLMKERKRLPKNSKELNKLHEIISSDVIKKNKMIKAASAIISPRTFKRNNKGIKRRWKQVKIPREILESIISFYQEDIHSKLLPGKKDYLTNKKNRKQKRLLLHPIKDLHTKYNTTHSRKVSYSTFLKLKPFWVVYPKMSDRNTCACIKCSNVDLFVNKAFHVGLINASCVKDLIKQINCNTNNKDCMYRICSQCKNIDFTHNLNDTNQNEIISVQQWQFVKVKKNQTDDVFVRVTQKNSVECTKENLIQKLNTQLLPSYMMHRFQINHQYIQLKNLKDHLKCNEVYVHMDFSENYETKYHEEIQSMHFGASKRHLSLHTVVVYFKEENTIKVKSFCTVSNNTDHGAHAVWAHLSPILLELSEMSIFDTIHIQSDGPSSQYKNRFNLYLFSNISEYCKGIKMASWNYSVSGHGKGAADGVGGVVKRSADCKIKMGSDITDVKSFIDAVASRTQSITLYEVPSQQIVDFKSRITGQISKIPQISHVHQVTWTQDNPKKLFTRELSCFECPLNNVCVHYALRKGWVILEQRTEMPRSILFCINLSI